MEGQSYHRSGARAGVAWRGCPPGGKRKPETFVAETCWRTALSCAAAIPCKRNLLCAGEFKVAVEIYPDGILRMKQDGCPAAIVFPNPTPAHMQRRHYGIYANTPHPHAAALFIDFELSAEGAKILAGNRPSLRDEKVSDRSTKSCPILKNEECRSSSSVQTSPSKWPSRWKKS